MRLTDLINTLQTVRNAGFDGRAVYGAFMVTAPSGKIEVFSLDDLTELAGFIRQKPNNPGIILEDKWRARKTAPAAARTGG
ncbi:MAG: hypothetical protein QHH75_10405 [Bacillota bacterium]|nr:hypothetical protein [Bacillota bacterium]